jgi:predicted aspartyl protease
MAHWTGYQLSNTSPALKVKICGAGTEQEFEAIIDTGFTGFVSMPLTWTFPLGLMLLGSIESQYADGNVGSTLAFSGYVIVGTERREGIITLEPNSNFVLLGMAFLRLFKRALYVNPNDGTVLLMDEGVINE